MHELFFIPSVDECDKETDYTSGLCSSRRLYLMRFVNPAYRLGWLGGAAAGLSFSILESSCI